MTTTEPLEEQYFKWLYENFVGFSDEEPGITHWRLCSQLQHKAYRWTVPNDDNRAEDGKFLREKFFSENPGVHDGLSQRRLSDFLTEECSVFEFLIALSERAEFESMNTQMWWFHDLLGNLRLLELNDHVVAANPSRCWVIIDGLVDAMLDRHISPNGRGGLFPLRHPPVDQRTAEVWYQMSTYILEL